MGDVTKKLLIDGIQKFVEPFDALLEGIELAREGVVTGRPPTIKSSIPDELEPAIAKRVEQARSRGRGQAPVEQGRVALGRPGRARDR